MIEAVQVGSKQNTAVWFRSAGQAQHRKGSAWQTKIPKRISLIPEAGPKMRFFNTLMVQFHYFEEEQKVE